tara:strand:+ start:248 stop:898 length:651 start_codon:yes stop_codon:yes gene_type:complete
MNLPMKNLTISIFGNQFFSEIVSELNLFANYKIQFYADLLLFKKNIKNNEDLLVFFEDRENKSSIEILKEFNFPIIFVKENKNNEFLLTGEFIDYLEKPFAILEFKKKVVSLYSKFEFKKRSLIILKQYTLDKNERKIKKSNLSLQLTEKEIYFLLLFSKSQNPIPKDEILKTVWNYSMESDTHTVETHIHRLRKKILEKFGDDNFIKNNDKGYYI